jgi:parvulin-like peptidyl-prolyl isomerase
MNGGLLGNVPRGQLFPELEPVAFALAGGEISAVAESPIGFHILYCEAVIPESRAPLAEVGDRLRTHIEDSRRAAAQKAWIAGLFQPV